MKGGWQIIFNCAWCMENIASDQSLSAIDVKFVKDIDFSDKEGEIIQVYLKSLQKSVPMIVTTSDPEAKKMDMTACSQSVTNNAVKS